MMRGAALVLAAGALSSCACPPAVPAPGAPLPRRGDEIVVCGRLYHIGVPVVLWLDPGGYDAYRVEPRFPAEAGEGVEFPSGPRYGTRRGLPEALAERVRRRGWTVEDLARQVRMFVVHYDACGTSRRCFKVLQDRRGLSVHFLLDVDGTLYQTLDLKERAWHAGKANDRSVGVEIAQIGAYPRPDDPALTAWYARDAGGLRVRFPASIEDPGLRTPGYVPRPARGELFSGVVQGRHLYQYDFTEAQYRSLAHLLAALNRILRIPLRVPRAPSGRILDHALDPEELAGFEGVVGHWHVTTRKIDPGPAFDWDRVLAAARALRYGRSR